MDYLASITYRNPVPDATDRAVEASKDHRLLGLRCPTCQRVYAGGRGYCPIDALELGPDCEVELPHTGTITNFSIVTPVQYPGQTETEPFVRAFVLLDGTDVIVPYAAVIDLPADEVRVGRGWRPSGPPRPRRSTREAAWAGPGARSSAGSRAASPTSTTPTW